MVVSGSVLLDSPKSDLRLQRGAAAFIPDLEAPVNVHPVARAPTEPAVAFAVTTAAGELIRGVLPANARVGGCPAFPGTPVHEQSGPGWSFLAIEEKNPAGKVIYAPYGPVASPLEAFDAATGGLVALATEERCGLRADGTRSCRI